MIRLKFNKSLCTWTNVPFAPRAKIMLHCYYTHQFCNHHSPIDQATSKSAKDLLIEEIAKMTEDNAAELAQSIKSKLAAVTSTASTKPETKEVISLY